MTETTSPNGLTAPAARELLESVGPNAIPDTEEHAILQAAKKLWAPVPWMLEAAIALELVLRNFTEAVVIAGLLLFNSAIGYFQEGKAQATLAALKSRLSLSAAVRRDGNWIVVPSAQVVPGDLVKLSLGGVVAADVTIVSGSVLVDESMLTGESEPVEVGPGATTFASALVRRGEAVAQVTATGPTTKFGNAAALVMSAHVVSSQQKVVLRIVRNLALFNVAGIVLLATYASIRGLAWKVIVPLVLTAVLASIPVALPATFTLATALGARALAKLGVLPTRLSSVDEAASMDVLCSDKTGTLTMNQLTVEQVVAMTGFDDARVLSLGAQACSDGSQDPVELAIRAASRPSDPSPITVTLTPFDPAAKMSDATVQYADATTQRVVLGAVGVVTALSNPAPESQGGVDQLAKLGLRVLAVSEGAVGQLLTLVGLIGLSDPPRDDSAALISELAELGVRTVMVTGDSPATATSVARAVGLAGPVCPPGPLPDDVRPEQFAVFAGIFPEGKFDLVKAFQKSGHVVGMCGDGANDAPALRQAQMGVAVSTATDVAKSAAGVVLTTGGLAGIVAAVKEGRSAYQRILTYALNTITKKITNVLFITIGLIITGHAILTPMLMVIVMITGDFLGMSVATDNVRPAPSPAKWRVGRLTMAGGVIGGCFLAFCVGSLLVGRYQLGFSVAEMQSLCTVTLVFGGEAILYNVRERHHLWRSLPGKWVIIATVVDVMLISTMAVRGFVLKSLPFVDVALIFASAVVFALLLDVIKVPLFRRLGLARSDTVESAH